MTVWLGRIGWVLIPLAGLLLAPSLIGSRRLERMQQRVEELVLRREKVEGLLPARRPGSIAIGTILSVISGLAVFLMLKHLRSPAMGWILGIVGFLGGARAAVAYRKTRASRSPAILLAFGTTVLPWWTLLIASYQALAALVNKPVLLVRCAWLGLLALLGGMVCQTVAGF